LPQEIKVVSLFDGISCGRVALERAGYPVSSYIAFEIDKFARAISRHNYPDIQHLGDVLDADFSQLSGYDIVIGGSPCNFWSCAKQNREIDKTGHGWRLFMRFVEAVQLIKPQYFFYENVASMPNEIKAYISEELGCEPILINSALVSAQHRERLYWTNIPGITQPHDKGILLNHVLDTGLSARNKSQTTLSTLYKENALSMLKRNKTGLFIAEESTPIRVGQIGLGGQGNRVYCVKGKTITLMGNGGGRGAKTGLYKIELPDGEYSIRKLSVIEAERCQTLPDNYTAYGINDDGKLINISNTQRYKTIGNGWTVNVIAHIFRHMKLGGD